MALLHLLWTHDGGWDEWMRVTLGPPLVCGAIMFSVSLLIGLMGADYPDGAREWLARSGALLALASAGWLVLFGIAFYGPYAVALALGSYGKTTMAAIAAWIGTGAAGVLAGSSSRTGVPTGNAGESGVARLAGGAGAAARHGGISAAGEPGRAPGVRATLDTHAAARGRPVSEALQVDVRVPPRGGAGGDQHQPIGRPPALDARLRRREGVRRVGYHDVFAGARTCRAASGACRCCCSVCVLVHVGGLGAHQHQRVLAAQLLQEPAGALLSRGVERLDPRAEPADRLRSARRLSRCRTLTPDSGYPGPYPIVNTTLNLNVGSELSQQERKGASFVMTPAYCGFDVQPSMRRTTNP